jgi:HrpA-like RNA helicase
MLPIISSPLVSTEARFDSLPPVISLNNPSNLLASTPLSTKKNWPTREPTTQELAKLPLVISTHLPSLAEAITEHDYLLVSSPTGTGKSLGIPWILSRQGQRVVVSVPTVAAAESLAARQEKMSPGIEVGYAAESKIHYSENTQVIYATSGHIRRRFLDFYRGISNPESRNNHLTKLIEQTDVLILDEIHLGSLDDYINNSLWKYGYQQGYSLPKLILSSATVEENLYPKAFRYTVETESYPVEVYYHSKNYVIGDRRLIDDLVDVIYKFHTSTLDGDILVFVAGKNEIYQVTNKLEELLKSPGASEALIIQAHGNLTHQEFLKIYQQPGWSRELGRSIENPPRKIIISTNIAETSITIEGINLVIDSMTEKRSETSATGGFRLSLHYVSQSSAIQRKGRTGRTKPGICYRMCTAEFFLRLEKNRPEEITRVPIYNTVMELMEAGLDPEKIIINLNQQSIRQAMDLLFQLGLITSRREVTEAGHFVTEFPLNIRNSTTLWKWVQAGYPLYPGVVVLSLLDSYGPSYFWFPSQNQGESYGEYNQRLAEHKEDYFKEFEGYSDVETLLNLWNDMTNSVGGPQADQRTITNWASENSINNRKFKEALRIINQVKNSLARLNFTVAIGPFTTEGVVKALRPLAENTYQDLIMLRSKGSQPNYHHPKTKETYRLDQRSTVNKLTIKLPARVIPFAMAEIQSGGTIRLINLALDLEPLPEPKINELETGNLASSIPSLVNIFPTTTLTFQN